MASDRPIVVKLGGSFAYLGIICRIDRSPCGVRRPGRNRSGRRVHSLTRCVGRKYKYDLMTEPPISMAVLAMEQYGRALASFNKGKLFARGLCVDAIQRDLERKSAYRSGCRRQWFWRRRTLRSHAEGVTSDSLAAWLAAGRSGPAGCGSSSTQNCHPAPRDSRI